MWRYRGEGWFAGIPMRDMTDEEFRAAEQIEPGLKVSGVYEHVADSEHPRLAARAEAAAEGSVLAEPKGKG